MIQQCGSIILPAALKRFLINNDMKGLFLVLISLACSFCLSAQTTSEIIQKNLEALGGEDLIKNVKSFYTQHSILISETFTVTRTYFVDEEKYRMEQKAPYNQTQIEIINKNSGVKWDGEKKVVLNSDQINSNSGKRVGILVPLISNNALFKKEINENGLDYYLLEYFTEKGDPYQYYVNKLTGLVDMVKLTYYDSSIGSMKITSQYEDYREIQGIYIPHKITVLETGQVTKVGDTRINLKMDSELFDLNNLVAK